MFSAYTPAWTSLRQAASGSPAARAEPGLETLANLEYIFTCMRCKGRNLCDRCYS